MELIRFWHDGNKINIRCNISLYVPFEEMADAVTGPSLIEAIASELKRAGFAVADHLACRWYKVVQLKASQKRSSATAVIGDGDEPTSNVSLPMTYDPDFTIQQKESMLQGLQQLVREFEHDQPRLVEILEQYRQDIEQNMPLEVVSEAAGGR